VSKLGDFDSYGADPRRIEKAGDSFNGVKVDYASKYKSALSVVKNNYEALKVPYYGLDNDDYVNGLGFCCKPATTTTATTATTSPTGKTATSKADNAELQQYYYHPDHLGSSSYITNLDGEVVQHVEYVPFGEVFLEEKNAVWNTPYLFNGKELDKETGLNYFSARYQDPKTGIFISVDPLAEQTMSSYGYCYNNPVNLIDPTGMSAEDPNEQGNKNWIGRAWDTVKSWFGGSNKSKKECQITVGPAVSNVIPDKENEESTGSSFLESLSNNPNHAGYGYSPNMKPPSAKDWNKLPNISYDENDDGIVTVDEVAQNQFDIANCFFMLSCLEVSATKGEFINLASSKRTTHIIAGDATGGGHAWFGSFKSLVNGLTRSKSMFPASWSNSKIMHAISDVAVNNQWIQQTGKAGAMFTKSGQPVRFVVEGTYQGTKIRVITTHTDIITAFPIK
jgi:RHS repeat-associated protein